MKSPWNENENRALVALYFEMLDKATAGQSYNKAAMIRVSQDHAATSDVYCGELEHRSRGSIEAKLMNASAAHAAIDPEAVTMAGFGYKAWGNYQASLKAELELEITRRYMANPFAADARLPA